MRTTGGSPWAALLALVLGFFPIVLDTTTISVAIPALRTSLHTGLNTVVWINSAYLLAFAAPMLFTSRLGDHYGPTRVYLAGLALFTGASLGCGLATGAVMLIAARAVQGLGSALLTPQTLVLITHLFAPTKRGPAMGVWGALAGVATVAGPLLGGVLVDGPGWRWIFLLNVPIDGLALVCTRMLVPDRVAGHPTRLDLIGVLLSGPGLALVVLGLQNAQTYGRATATVLLGAGAVLLSLFLLRQRHNRRYPLLPLEVFADRNFAAAALTTATVGFALTGMFVPLFLYLQAVRGLSPTAAGLLTAPMSLLAAAVSPLAGLWSDRISRRLLVTSGLITFAAGLTTLVAQAGPTAEPGHLVPALLVAGLGMGLVFSPLNNLAMSTVATQLRSAASGVFYTTRQIGAVLGSASAGALLPAHAGLGGGAVRAGLLVPAAVLLAGTGAIATVRPHQTRRRGRR